MATYHSFVSIGSTSGWIVPQRVYTANGHTPGPTITFTQNSAPGVLLSTAVSSTFSRGDPANTGMPDGTTIADIRTHDGGRIKLRILWPGCLPYEKMISVVVGGRLQGEPDGRLLTKAELAHKIALVVQDFLQHHSRSADWADEQIRQWAPNQYSLAKIFLHDLRHVSRGSYQPVLVIA